MERRPSINRPKKLFTKPLKSAIIEKWSILMSNKLLSTGELGNWGLITMEIETEYLLLGFNPVEPLKKHLFWKEWDEKVKKMERQKEHSSYLDWKKQFEQTLQGWRFSKNNLTEDLYFHLARSYPEPIPSCLFFTYRNAAEAEELKWIGDLADKWLKDVFSGESFYKRNKEYFSKAEVRYFLTCDWLDRSQLRQQPQHYNYGEQRYFIASYYDLIESYFDAKIMASDLDVDAYIFARTFGLGFLNKIVQDFFRFIQNNKKNIKETDSISDICDFLNHEYIEPGIDFDFNNRTWQNVSRLSDEWHLENRITGDPNFKKYINSEWEKSTIKDFFLETDGKKWVILEITTGKLLHEEAQVMHHCCFSYIDNCIKKNCVLFSVKCTHDNQKEGEGQRIATVEISSGMKLIQARGKYNRFIESETEKIIKIWADENKIDTSGFSKHQF